MPRLGGGVQEDAVEFWHNTREPSSLFREQRRA